MSNLVNLFAESGAGLVEDGADPVLDLRNIGTGPAVKLQAGVGSMTIGMIRIIGNSVASGAVFEFAGKGSFISITSVVLTTVANTDYAIPVQVGLETRYIPVFKAAALAGAAAFS